MTSNLFHSVKNYLSTQCMNVEDEWLSGCIEYLQEDSTNNYSERDIQNLAREQWLLNDLKDICPGCLPPGLVDTVKTIINGRYILQINAAVDIGTPAYQQYLKLQKVNTENIEATIKYDEKISSHRMIKLYLTDGAQELSAIEYKPMRNLTCDVIPGSKIVIKGPIECRRGVLLLTESAIELLGGEVEEIAISNSLAGMLSSKLGLPMTQDTNLNSTISHPRNTNIPTPHSEMPSARPVDDFPVFELTADHTRPVARVTSLQVANFADDDIDVDQLAAIEEEFTENPGKRTIHTENTKPEKKLKVETTINNPDDYPNDEDLFMEEDVDYLRELEAKFDSSEEVSVVKRSQSGLSAEPFVYIKQINNLSDAEKAGRVFRVKAQIMKVLSKLCVGKDGWSLKCTIVDGTGNIDVEFTSAVLSKIFGYTPQEMNQLASNPSTKERAIKALQKAKDTLQVLYSIFELTMLDVPKITCLIPFDDTHVSLLKKRMQSSGL